MYLPYGNYSAQGNGGGSERAKAVSPTLFNGGRPGSVAPGGAPFAGSIASPSPAPPALAQRYMGSGAMGNGLAMSMAPHHQHHQHHQHHHNGHLQQALQPHLQHGGAYQNSIPPQQIQQQQQQIPPAQAQFELAGMLHHFDSAHQRPAQGAQCQQQLARQPLHGYKQEGLGFQQFDDERAMQHHYQQQAQVPIHVQHSPHQQHAQGPIHVQHPPHQHRSPQHAQEQHAQALQRQMPAHDIRAPKALPVSPKPGTKTQEPKRKRGRPKKLILDPSTNEYVDSSHERFRHLNKLLKSSAVLKQPRPKGKKALLLDANLFLADSDDNAGIHRLYEKPPYLRTLEDDAVKKLLEKKDRRGRPRKFPIEETGLTIRGIRVNGSYRYSRKQKGPELAGGPKAKRHERGRPRKSPASLSSDMSYSFADGI